MNPSMDYLVVFEDEHHDQFYPISVSRPLSHILTGARTNIQRIRHYFPKFEICLACRPHLRDLFNGLDADGLKQIQHNPSGKLILINARVILKEEDQGVVDELTNDDRFAVYLNGKTLVAATIPLEKLKEIDQGLLELYGAGSQDVIISAAQEKREVDVKSLSNIWEAFKLNPDLIALDSKAYYDDWRSSGPCGDAFVYNRSDIFVGDNVSFDAASVIDARGGPIIIESGVSVKPFTYLQGPAYVGQGCMLVGGKMSDGCSFGEGCRIGGEVENTIFVANSNKYHDGFIGHAYVGEWVNLGALTTNSDLANNYSDISVKQFGTTKETGQMKIGCFIGDHTKIGIGMTLNTGSVIGFASNLFGGNLILEKEVPSFTWGNDALRYTFRLNKAVETARVVLDRRGHTFGRAHEKLFESIYNDSKSHREKWQTKKRLRA